MIKRILCLLPFLITSAALASPCVDELLLSQPLNSLGKISDHTNSQCLLQNSDFLNAAKELCTADQKNTSLMFQNYLNFYNQSEELKKNSDFQAELGRNTFYINMQSLEMRWKVEGFKNEVEGSLFSFYRATRNCK